MYAGRRLSPVKHQLLAIGIGLGIDQGIKDGEHFLSEGNHYIESFPVSGIVVDHRFPLRYNIGRDIDVPAQIVNRMSSKEKTIKEAGFPLGRRTDRISC